MIIELEMLQAKLAQLPGFPAGAENSARTSDHQPSRAVRIRIAQAADVSRSADVPLSRRSRLQDGSMRAHFEREAELDGPWTSYNASLGRPLLDSRKFMQGEETAGAEESRPKLPACRRLRVQIPTPTVPERRCSTFSLNRKHSQET